MDIQLQTKISVLLEKIYYLQHSMQQNGGIVSKVDKDLLVNYVRELYELTLTLPVISQQPYPQQNYPYPPPPPPAPEYQQPYLPPAYPQNPGVQQQPYIQPSAPEPTQQSPFSSKGFIKTPVNGVINTPNTPNGSNGSYANGNTNGSQPLNASFTFSNGKRTLSESIKIKTAGDKPSLNEQFRKGEPEYAGKMNNSPIKDLKTFIGLNKRFSYINFLFGNDAGLYDEAIEKINSSKSIGEARSYIENNLMPRLNWDDNNEMVDEFNSLVERRFSH